MATSDKSDKSGKQGTSRPRTTRATSRKKATRPPTIDLEATEVAEASATEPPPPEGAEKKSAGEKPVDEKSSGEPSDNVSAESASVKEPAAMPAGKTKAKSTSEQGSASSASATKAKAATTTESAKKAPVPGSSTQGSSTQGSSTSVKPDPVEPAPTVAPQPELAGFSLIAVGGAAAAGALLSLAVLVGLDRVGVLPWRADTSGIDPVQVTAKLEALETQLSGLAKKAPATDSALNSRVANLEKDLNTAGSAIAALPDLIDTLAARLDGLETTLGDTQAKTQSALTGLKNIETTVGTISAGDGTQTPSSEAIQLKLSALASRVDQIAAQSQSNESDVPARFDGLEQTLTQIRAATSASDDRINEIAGQVAAIPESVSPDAFAKALNSVRGAIEARLDTIEQRLGGPGETRGAASAIVLASLRRAIDRGTPFAAELAAFSALVPDEPASGVVQPYASGGLMTRAELAARFATVVEESLRTTSDKEASQDITGSILSRLQTVVKVRRTGDGDGSDAGAVMARMAKSLTNGDLAGAVAQGNAAGDVLSTGPKDWLKTAQARLAADKALADADGRMLAALAKSGD